MKSEKEIVIVRDIASFEWLDLANFGYKLKVYIPAGGRFEPQNVDMSNIEIIEFEPNPEKIWDLLDRMIGSAKEAYDCIHVIEIDAFSRERYDIMVNWWCRFAETLMRYKQVNKGRRVCWIIDEFQTISVPPRSGRKLFEKHVQASAVLSNALTQFRKYKVRVIACVNPLSAIDNTLRPQFSYYVFKSMRITEHEKWSEHLSKYTQDCRQNEFVLFCTRATQNTAGGTFDRIEFRTQIVANPDIIVDVTPSPLFFAQQQLPEERYENHARRLTRLIVGLNRQGYCCTHCGKTITIPTRQLASMAGWRSPGSLAGHVSAHPPDLLGSSSGEEMILKDDSQQPEANSHQTSSEQPQRPSAPSSELSRKSPEEEVNSFEDDIIEQE
jgi:hypothetical protein